MIKYTEMYNIKISLELRLKLKLLKKYSIKRSDFVRKAIEEKLERDLPLLKLEKEKNILPF